MPVGQANQEEEISPLQRYRDKEKARDIENQKSSSSYFLVKGAK